MTRDHAITLQPGQAPAREARQGPSQATHVASILRTVWPGMPCRDLLGYSLSRASLCHVSKVLEAGGYAQRNDIPQPHSLGCSRQTHSSPLMGDGRKAGVQALPRTLDWGLVLTLTRSPRHWAGPEGMAERPTHSAVTQPPHLAVRCPVSLHPRGGGQRDREGRKRITMDRR